MIIYSYLRSSAKVKPINRKEANYECIKSRKNLVRLSQNPFQKIRFVPMNRFYPIDAPKIPMIVDFGKRNLFDIKPTSVID